MNDGHIIFTAGLAVRAAANDPHAEAHEKRLQAQLRLVRAKDSWTKTAVRHLHTGVTTEEVAAALAELAKARAELATLDHATAA